MLPPLQGHGDWIRSVAFSPDGSKIISGSDDKTIRVWDASTGVEILPPLRGHDSDINSVAFSPDGSKIISGSDDRTIRVWDVSTGVEMLLPLPGHEDDYVSPVTILLDGSEIVSEFDDETVQVQDTMHTNTGNEQPSMQITADVISQSAMDSPVISLVDRWFTDTCSGRHLARLPVENSYYGWRACGSTFVGWTSDHKPVIVQLHVE